MTERSSSVSGILTLDVGGWTLSVRVHDGGYEVSITEDGKCPASHYVRLDPEQADTLRDFMAETSPPAADAVAGPNRDQIAAIIDPTAWIIDSDGHCIEQQHGGESLEKADAILALIADAAGGVTGASRTSRHNDELDSIEKIGPLEIEIAGPYLYAGDKHPSLRLACPDRIVASVYVIDGDEDRAFAEAQMIKEAFRLGGKEIDRLHYASGSQSSSEEPGK